MPDHSPEHLAEMNAASASSRRAKKIADLVATAPPLTPEQIDSLRALLHGHPRLNGGRS